MSRLSALCSFAAHKIVERLLGEPGSMLPILFSWLFQMHTLLLSWIKMEFGYRCHPFLQLLCKLQDLQLDWHEPESENPFSLISLTSSISSTWSFFLLSSFPKFMITRRARLVLSALIHAFLFSNMGSWRLQICSSFLWFPLWSLCPMSPNSHFLKKQSPSLFSWMDLNTILSTLALFRLVRSVSFPPKISRSSLLKLVQHDWRIFKKTRVLFSKYSYL